MGRNKKLRSGGKTGGEKFLTKKIIYFKKKLQNQFLPYLLLYVCPVQLLNHFLNKNWINILKSDQAFLPKTKKLQNKK